MNRPIITFVLVFVLCAGCGQRLPVAPVSGMVTLDGEPLADASITTHPVATDTRNPGPGSFGRTDAQGRFDLELVNPAMKGAIIGEHRVIISPAAGQAVSKAQRSADGSRKVWTDAPQPSMAEAAKWPPSFSDGSLRMQVPAEGTSEVRLDLKQ